MPILNRPIEDRARALSYAIGVAWSITFLIFVPSFYATLIDEPLLRGWGVLAAAGCTMALVGSLRGVDFKLELPGIYLIQVSSLLYFTAQFGFFMPQSPMVWTDRIAGAAYILWHSSLFWPRWWGLASAARRVRLVARAAR